MMRFPISTGHGPRARAKGSRLKEEPDVQSPSTSSSCSIAQPAHSITPRVRLAGMLHAGIAKVCDEKSVIFSLLAPLFPLPPFPLASQ
eukprot:scaffold102064_cov33-Tisochrysis_lutea.AAC.1